MKKSFDRKKNDVRLAACAVLVLIGFATTGAFGDEVQLKSGDLVFGIIQAVDDSGIRILVPGNEGKRQVRTIRHGDYTFYSMDAAPDAPITEEKTIPIVEEGSGRFSYGKVIQVFSSISYRFRSNTGQTSLVRLIGVLPERDLAPGSGGKSFSALATKSATHVLQLENYRVRLEFDKVRQDKDGRLLAYMFVGEGDNPTLLNEKLIELGYARFEPDEKNTLYAKQLEAAEEHAKQRKLGLWPFEGMSEVDRLSALSHDPTIKVENFNNFYDPYSGKHLEQTRTGTPNAMATPESVSVSPQQPTPPPGEGTLAERLAQNPNTTAPAPTKRPTPVGAAASNNVAPAPQSTQKPAESKSQMSPEVKELLQIIKKKDEQLDRLLDHLLAEKMQAAQQAATEEPAQETPASATGE